MNENEIRNVLIEFCKQYRYKYMAANALNIAHSSLYAMLSGSRGITTHVAKGLGYIARYSLIK